MDSSEFDSSVVSASALRLRGAKRALANSKPAHRGRYATSRPQSGRAWLSAPCLRGAKQPLERGKREAIFDIIELRGLPLDTASRERIETCTDLEQLDRWRTLAKRVGSLEHLFE